jgi:serine/threonine protein kinase
LPTSLLAPSDLEKLQAIIQAGVDAVHGIDRRGVLHMSVAPHNVVVNSRTQTPYIVDFGNCDFKDRMIKLWKESGCMDDDDDENIKYWERVVTQNNGQAIGRVMARRLQRVKGVKLNITYPDCDKILKDLKRSRGVEFDENSGSGWKIMHF